MESTCARNPTLTITTYISLSLSLSVSGCLHSTTSMSGLLTLAHANSLLRPLLKNMLILSSVPSPSPTFSATPTPTPPSPSSNLLSVSLPLRSTSSRSLASSCSLYSLKVTANNDVVMAKDSPPENLATSVSYRTFLSARTEQELLSGIRKEAEAGSLPSDVAAAMEELYQNYKNAVFQSGDPRADEIVLSNMIVALDRIFLDVVEPFVFKPHHKAKREPFDYYMFGQNYIRPLIDFRNSYVGNVLLFYEMEENLKQGHNVILMSNHQTEADPAIIALLLEKPFSYIVENMTYVAGDRVLTDPLCKPFSMGRNLICVYSKKHMNDVPELVEMKRKANTRSLKEMAMLLREEMAGLFLYIPIQTEWVTNSLDCTKWWQGSTRSPQRRMDAGRIFDMAAFDASSVDNMRRLVEHAGPPSHIYPLALLCHDIMPPPLQVEKEIGEKRVICFHGAGLSVAPEISFSETTAACETPETAKEAYTQALFNSVTEQYNVLKSAIHGQRGLEASVPNVSLSQPWN